MMKHGAQSSTFIEDISLAMQDIDKGYAQVSSELIFPDKALPQIKMYH